MLCVRDHLGSASLGDLGKPLARLAVTGAALAVIAAFNAEVLQAGPWVPSVTECVNGLNSLARLAAKRRARHDAAAAAAV